MSSALSDITKEGRSEVSGIIILISESGKKVHAHTEELFPSPHSMTLHFLHTPHSPQGSIKHNTVVLKNHAETFILCRIIAYYIFFCFNKCCYCLHIAILILECYCVKLQ